MAILVTDALQFLHQKRTDSPSTEWLRDVHEDVTVRTVVVKQDAAGRRHQAVNFDETTVTSVFRVHLWTSDAVGSRNVAPPGACDVTWLSSKRIASLATPRAKV